MASRSVSYSFTRRLIVSEHQSLQAFARAHSSFAPARRRCLYERPGPKIPVEKKRRAFSISSSRRFADVDDSFDPRQQDRESDEVDVCIVGGGRNAILPVLYIC